MHNIYVFREHSQTFRGRSHPNRSLKPVPTHLGSPACMCQWTSRETTDRGQWWYWSGSKCKSRRARCHNYSWERRNRHHRLDILQKRLMSTKRQPIHGTTHHGSTVIKCMRTGDECMSLRTRRLFLIVVVIRAERWVVVVVALGRVPRSLGLEFEVPVSVGRVLQRQTDRGIPRVNPHRTTVHPYSLPEGRRGRHDDLLLQHLFVIHGAFFRPNRLAIWPVKIDDPPSLGTLGICKAAVVARHDDGANTSKSETWEKLRKIVYTV